MTAPDKKPRKYFKEVTKADFDQAKNILTANLNAEELIRELTNPKIAQNCFKIKKLLQGDLLNLSHQNNDGDTALMMSVYQQEIDYVRMMLKRGADVNIQNNHGETALFYALKVDNDKIVSVLLDAGADVNVYLKAQECTVLHYAIMQAMLSGNVRSVQRILDKDPKDVEACFQGVKNLTSPLVMNKKEIIAVLERACLQRKQQIRNALTGVKKPGTIKKVTFKKKGL